MLVKIFHYFYSSFTAKKKHHKLLLYPNKIDESTKYIDPNLTLHMNGIEENSVVFCMRTDQILGEKGVEGKTDFEYNQEKDNERIKNN